MRSAVGVEQMVRARVVKVDDGDPVRFRLARCLHRAPSVDPGYGLIRSAPAQVERVSGSVARRGGSG